MESDDQGPNVQPTEEPGYPFKEKDNIKYIIDNTKFLLDCPPLKEEGFTSPSFYIYALVAKPEDPMDTVRCWTIDAYLDSISRQAAQEDEALDPPELTTQLPNEAKLHRCSSPPGLPLDPRHYEAGCSSSSPSPSSSPTASTQHQHHNVAECEKKKEEEMLKMIEMVKNMTIKDIIKFMK